MGSRLDSKLEWRRERETGFYPTIRDTLLLRTIQSSSQHQRTVLHSERRNWNPELCQSHASLPMDDRPTNGTDSGTMGTALSYHDPLEPHNRAACGFQHLSSERYVTRNVVYASIGKLGGADHWPGMSIARSTDSSRKIPSVIRPDGNTSIVSKRTLACRRMFSQRGGSARLQSNSDPCLGRKCSEKTLSYQELDRQHRMVYSNTTARKSIYSSR
jgi:hypothetical protein